MKLIILITFSLVNFLLCQSQGKLGSSEGFKDTGAYTSTSKCKTTSYQPGKEFPNPKLNLPKEFGDGKEFFPSFQCFNEVRQFDDIDLLISYNQLLITKKNNLVTFFTGSCAPDWKNRTNACVSILLFRFLEGKYIFVKRYEIEVLNNEKAKIIADDDENLYLFTYRIEDLERIKNPKPIARKGVACIIKIDTKMDKVVFSTNLLGNPSLDDELEFQHIFNPLDAGNVSLVYGDGKVVAFFAKLLGYDDIISSRHQNSLFTAIDSSTGEEFIGINGYSHSLAQYVTYDPKTKNFLGLEVGDGYDRAVGLSILKIQKGKIEKKTAKVYLIPGPAGANETATYIGNVIPTEQGYLVSFSTEREPRPRHLYSYFLEDNSRTSDLALVRILRDFPKKESNTTNANVDPSWKGDIVKVEQDHGIAKNNGIRWITKNKKGDRVLESHVFLIGDVLLFAHVKRTEEYPRGDYPPELIVTDLNGKVLRNRTIEDYDYSHLRDFSNTLVTYYDQVGNAVGVAYLVYSINTKDLELVVVDKDLKIRYIPCTVQQ